MSDDKFQIVRVNGLTAQRISFRIGDNIAAFGAAAGTTIPSTDEPPDKKARASDIVEPIHSKSDIVTSSDNIRNPLGDVDSEKTINVAEETCKVQDKITGSDLNGNKTIRDIWVHPDKSRMHNADNSINTSEENSSTRVPHANGVADVSILEQARNENRDEAGKKIKWDCGRHFSDQTDQGSSETPENEKRDDGALSTGQEDDPTAETNVSPEEPPRNKCAYGSRCFRRNSSHKAQFSHPGDPDYDIPDTRPECPYGIRCYRKNPDHKRNYKHTRVRSIRAQTPIRGRASDAASGTEQSSAEESVDESEYEPSIGATSDEYRSDLDGFSDFDAISDVEDDK